MSNKNIYSFLAILLLASNTVWSQQLVGSFSGLPEQTIKLYGFEGMDTYVIDSVTADSTGAFTLNFTTSDYGMGYLSSIDNTPLVVVLGNEQIKLSAVAPSQPATVQIEKGAQNKAFFQYASEQPKREQAISAWKYLQKIYQADSLFAKEAPNKAIVAELERLEKEEQKYIDELPTESYVQWFLPIRKLVSSVSVVAQYRTQDIPATRAALRALDYSDTRMHKSGLFSKSLENHIWFLENSSGALDDVYADINTSIDILLAQLATDETKYNEVVDFLFNLLEERSLLTSSEYLALKVLGDQSCMLTDDVADQLEGYRKMKIGNQAPNIVLSEATENNQKWKAKSLYDIKSEYTLVVFAAGWCGHCQTEIPKLNEVYADWKDEGLEVLLVSLDETPEEFSEFVKDLSFISTTDFKKWDGAAATDYHVFGTPTMFLLDKEKSILVRPNSIEHLEAWLNWNISQK